MNWRGGGLGFLRRGNVEHLHWQRMADYGGVDDNCNDHAGNDNDNPCHGGGGDEFTDDYVAPARMRCFGGDAGQASGSERVLHCARATSTNSPRKTEATQSRLRLWMKAGRLN